MKKPPTRAFRHYQGMLCKWTAISEELGSFEFQLSEAIGQASLLRDASVGTKLEQRADELHQLAMDCDRKLNMLSSAILLAMKKQERFREPLIDAVSNHEPRKPKQTR